MKRLIIFIACQGNKSYNNFMDLDKLQDILKPYPAFRQKQVQEAVFSRLLADWEQASNLPKDLKEILKKEFPLDIKAEIFVSPDKKTVKAAIELGDKQIIETVLLRHDDGRNTACVSSQVGCALNCAFCATGQLGLGRDLTADEIISQILFFNRYLRPENERVSSVVFMGMGEPLLNYDEVIKAAGQINDKNIFNIGARHISVSTVGIVPGIKKLADFPLQVNLAISLHAPNDQLRQKLMPAAKKYPLKVLLPAAADYINKTNRKLMIEYLMLKNVNDSEAQAQELARLLKTSLKKLFFVNLIAYNPTGKFRASSPEQIKKFQAVLEKEGIAAVQRYRFGLGIKGACGQLGGGR